MNSAQAASACRWAAIYNKPNKTWGGAISIRFRLPAGLIGDVCLAMRARLSLMWDARRRRLAW